MHERAKAKRFHGRHVVVTGAGTGIGRAIALRLASEGARVSLLARDVGRLEEAAHAIARLAEGDAGVSSGASSRLGGAEAGAIGCDVRDATSVERAFAAARERSGPLHALVANAGIGGPNAPGDGDRFDELVLTNLTGTYRCLRAAQASLEPGPDPRHLVVVSSILARIGVPGYTGYCASKAGLMGLVRALAAELAPSNVQVNAVLPGWVETEMAREGLEGMARAMGTSFDEARRIAMEPVPLKRMSAPEDVAGVVAWLCSADARGVTGSCVDVNNGAWMG